MTEPPGPGFAIEGVRDAETQSVDTRSFAERFQGTQWGAPTEAPPAVPAGAQARRRRNLALWAGVLLLGGSVAAGALMAVGGADGTIGGPAPTDTLARAPSGTVAPEERAASINRFLARISVARPSYEVRGRGTLVVGSTTVVTDLSGKVVGADLDVRYEVERSPGSTAEARVIIRGSTVWVQGAGTTRWTKPKTRPAALPDTGVFAGLTDPDQLRHVGIEMRRGFTTDHLQTVLWWTSPMAAKAIAGYPGATVQLARLDVWVLRDGRPIEVTYTLRASFPATLAPGVVEGSMSYVLSRFGEKLPITPPR